MNKKSVVVYSMLAFAYCFAIFGVTAAKNTGNITLPDTDGTYDVLGHPDLKLHVITHKAKPSPTPVPVAACAPDGHTNAAMVKSTGWYMPANWSYSLNAASVPLTVGGSNLATIASLAFDAWNNEIGGAIDFTVKNTVISRAARDGQNVVTWGTAPSSALAITYIWAKSTGEVAELDTVMNKKYPWMWARSSNCVQKCSASEICAYTNAYDAQSILTHEVGHWYGLDDEYEAPYSDDTMFGYGDKWEAKGNTLEAGDIAGLKAIYR